MGMKTDWQSVTREFPVNEKLIWLNNCGTTPAGSFVQREMNAYLESYAGEGILAKGFGIKEIKGGITGILGGLLQSDPADIALIHNTAEGMNMISYGLDLKAKDEILLMEHEYPSNVYPWEHWGEKGIVLKTVPLGTTPEEFLHNTERMMTERTRVMSVSVVHWCTGMPLPVRELAGLCTARGIELVVDGAQGVGHVELRMDWGISFLAFSAWKWLLGPLGLGVLAVPAAKIEKLKMVFKGTNSVVDAGRYFPYKTQLLANAQRYTFSTPNFNDWVYFLASLRFLDSIGFRAVMARIYELADYLCSRLRELDFILDRDSYADKKTGIITAKHSKMDAAEIVTRLGKRGIIVRERLGRVRFAPHIYNTFGQIDETVTVIKSILPSYL